MNNDAGAGGPLLERKRLSELQRRLFGITPADIRISRYIVEELAGQGTFGSVYRGYDPQLRRPVAIKVLRDQHDAVGASLAENRGRLLREAQALARLTHPNVVGVYDVGVLDHDLTTHARFDVQAGVYVVMEYVDGPTLRGWLHALPRTPALILDRFMAAGRGLSAAHSRGIFHRDFKPDNTLIGSDGGVRVADFGLACTSDQAEPSLDEEMGAVPSRSAESAEFASTQPRLVGTPEYMAPEQHRGEAVDGRADQFAFCVALFEALHGARPFEAREGRTLYEAKLAAEITTTPNPEVPAAVNAVVRRGVQASRDARFGSMDALLEALADAQGAGVRRRTLWVRAAGLSTCVVALGAAFATIGGEAEVCESRDAAALASWSAEAQQETQIAFEQTGVPFAGETFQRAELRVDRHLESLTAEREAACEAQRGALGEAAVDEAQRARCLDERAIDAGELLRVFRDADASVVERAVERLDALERPESCATAQWRKSIDGRRSSRLFTTRFARMRASLAAGRRTAADTLAQSIVEDARQVGDRKSEGLALLWRGRILRDDRKGDEAADVLGAALSIAEELERPAWVAEASAELAAVEGTLRDHEARAAALVAKAVRALEEAGGPDESAFRLAVIQATLAREAGQPADALVSFKEAQRIATQARGPARTGPWASRVRTTDINLADTLTILGDYAQARSLIEPQLRDAEDRLGPWHPTVGRFLQSMGFVSARLEEHGAALTYARRALEVQERISGHSVTTAWVLNLVGACQIELGLHAEAVASHERAVAMLTDLQGPRDLVMLRARMNLGRARLEAGDPDGAGVDVDAAVAGLSAVLGEDHVDLSYAYITKGEIAVATGKPERARLAFEHALALRAPALGAEHPQVVMIEKKLAALPKGAPDTVE